MSAAEAAVKKLARAPGNTTCPNCGLDKKFGFGTVCMKFLTFVCNECKSSHQAISHRCKSLTMSSWTTDEVHQLQTQGGNDRARATWLATAPPFGQQGRPMSNGTSSIDTYKAFIVNVYERKMYYGNNTVAAAAPAPVVPSEPRVQVTAAPAPRRAVVAAPVAASAPVVADLLDFGSDDAAPNPTSTNTMFGDFGSAAATTTPVFDPFNTTASSTVSSASAATPVPVAPQASFDPFGHFGESNATSTNPSAMGGSVPKKTVMNPMGGSVVPPPVTGGFMSQPMNGNMLSGGTMNGGMTNGGMMNGGMMNGGVMNGGMMNGGMMNGNMMSGNMMNGNMMNGNMMNGNMMSGNMMSGNMMNGGMNGGMMNGNMMNGNMMNANMMPNGQMMAPHGMGMNGFGNMGMNPAMMANGTNTMNKPINFGTPSMMSAMNVGTTMNHTNPASNARMNNAFASNGTVSNFGSSQSKQQNDPFANLGI